MKPIQTQDIEKLRQELLARHDLLMDNFAMLKGVSNADHREMLARLEAADAQMDQLLALSEPITNQDPRVQNLYRDVNELRLYFGAPTGRPLEDRGVDYVAPHVQALRLLFQIDSSIVLYVEMIRTDLALLEYQLAHGQDISDCLASLGDSIALCRFRDQFTGLQDSHIFDLAHYLMLIHELLGPVLLSKREKALRLPISRVYLEMAMAFALFDCSPEDVDELFCDVFILSMMVQLLTEEPTLSAAQRCYTTALWLWEYKLLPEQKENVAQCYIKAKEVLENA